MNRNLPVLLLILVLFTTYVAPKLIDNLRLRRTVNALNLERMPKGAKRIKGIGYLLGDERCLYERLTEPSEGKDIANRTFKIRYSSKVDVPMVFGIMLQGKTVGRLSTFSVKLDLSRLKTIVYVPMSLFSHIGPVLKVERIKIKAPKVIIRRIDMYKCIKPAHTPLPDVHSSLTIDNFITWSIPSLNSVKGERRTTKYARTGYGVVKLYNYDTLIEYFPDHFDSSIYKTLRIYYSNGSDRTRIGFVRKSNTGLRGFRFWLDFQFQVGKNMQLALPLSEFLVSIPNFKLDSRNGIVISGSLTIFRIELDINEATYHHATISTSNHPETEYSKELGQSCQDEMNLDLSLKLGQSCQDEMNLDLSLKLGQSSQDEINPDLSKELGQSSQDEINLDLSL